MHVEDLPEREGKVVLGFDAGGSSSMTAAVCDMGKRAHGNFCGLPLLTLTWWHGARATA